MSLTATEFPPLKIALGPDSSGALVAGLPVLGGDMIEALFHGTQPAGRAGALTLFRKDAWLIGGATVSLAAGLEETARDHRPDAAAAAGDQGGLALQ